MKFIENSKIILPLKQMLNHKKKKSYHSFCPTQNNLRVPSTASIHSQLHRQSTCWSNINTNGTIYISQVNTNYVQV